MHSFSSKKTKQNSTPFGFQQVWKYLTPGMGEHHKARDLGRFYHPGPASRTCSDQHFGESSIPPPVNAADNVNIQRHKCSQSHPISKHENQRKGWSSDILRNIEQKLAKVPMAPACASSAFLTGPASPLTSLKPSVRLSVQCPNMRDTQHSSPDEETWGTNKDKDLSTVSWLPSSRAGMGIQPSARHA